MAIVNPPLPGEFNRKILLRCEAKVGGETVYAQIEVVEAVYNDSGAREAITRDLRRRLMDAILDKWSPVVKVKRREAPMW